MNKTRFADTSLSRKLLFGLGLFAFVQFLFILLFFVFFQGSASGESPASSKESLPSPNSKESQQAAQTSLHLMHEDPLLPNQSFSIPIDAQKFIEKKIQGMSLPQKVGQLIHIGMVGKKAKGQVLRDIRTFHPGGIILFGANFSGPDSVKKLSEGLQRAARKAGDIPLFLSTDQEGGRVFRLGAEATMQFPGAMAIGQADDPVLARKAGFVTGYELGRLGIRLIFAPVLDINNNPANPVIQTRSFGSDKERVIRNALPFLQGIASSLSVPVIKHFPGHGDTHTDSHLSLPVIQKTLLELEREELAPFQKAITSGAEALMTAHILFPKIDPKYPATLSHVILKKILRKKMGFRGLVISDAMEMKAISGRYGHGESAVRAIQAGVDVILLTSTGKILKEMHSALLHAFRTGRLSKSALDRSLKRQLYLKLKADLFAKAETQKLLSLDLPARRVAAELFYRHLAQKYSGKGLSLNRLLSRKSIRSLGKKYDLDSLFFGSSKEKRKGEKGDNEDNEDNEDFGNAISGHGVQKRSTGVWKSRGLQNKKEGALATKKERFFLYYKSGIMFDEALLHGLPKRNLKKLKHRGLRFAALSLPNDTVLFVELSERELPAWNRLVKIFNKRLGQKHSGNKSAPILVGLYTGNPFLKIRLPKRGAVLASFSPTAESRRALLYQALRGRVPEADLVLPESKK